MGREVLRRDLDRLERCAITRCMKFNKSKCWILYLGWHNSGYTYKLGDKRLENSLAERDLGRLGCWEVEYVPTAVQTEKRGQLCPGVQ